MSIELKPVAESIAGDEPRSVLGRTVLLLECFATGEDTLSLATLSARSGLPRSTAHRLIGSLVQLGLLERELGEYRLGLRVFEFGGLAPRRRRLRDPALPFMEDLFLATHETVQLALLDRGSVLYLEKISGHRSTPTASVVAGRLPAHCTALGKAILAFSPPADVAEVVAEPLARATRYTIASPERLRAELATIRETGVAYDREESRLGLFCVAAPVFDARKRVVAAISVTTSSGGADPTRLVPAVTRAALGASRSVAYATL